MRQQKPAKGCNLSDDIRLVKIRHVDSSYPSLLPPEGPGRNTVAGLGTSWPEHPHHTLLTPLCLPDWWGVQLGTVKSFKEMLPSCMVFLQQPNRKTSNALLSPSPSTQRTYTNRTMEKSKPRFQL